VRLSSKEILVGWKEIMAAFGVCSLITMKKKVRKYGIPILAVARKPTISIDEIREWQKSRKPTYVNRGGENL
jgi:hypothetical protein